MPEKTPLPTDNTAAQANQAPLVPSLPAPYVTQTTCLLMCGFTLVLTLAIGYFAPLVAAKFGHPLSGSSASAASKVVYLDFERLLEAGIKHSHGIGESDVQLIAKEANQFQADIGNLLQKYAAEGYVVINSKALIVGTKAQDITPAFIRTLGLTPASPTAPAVVAPAK